MKVAKYKVSSVEIKCPYCDGEVEEPCGGSLFWMVFEITPGESAYCENGHQFKLPRIKGVA